MSNTMMKLCVFFVLFDIVSLRAYDTSLGQARQSKDVIEPDIIKFSDDNEDEYEKDELIKSYDTRPTFPTTVAPSITKPNWKPTSNPNHWENNGSIVFPKSDEDWRPTRKPDPTLKPTIKPDHDKLDKYPELNKHEINKCMSECSLTAADQPVCGSNGVTYINQGHFACANKCGVAINTFSQGPCLISPPNSCPTVAPEPNNTTPSPSSDQIRQCVRNCPVTSEYDPVCGTNGFTYSNPGRLQCAKDCGFVVDLRARGPCRITTSSTNPPIIRNTTPTLIQKACLSRCPITSEYKPVCGTDYVTYFNSVRLFCAQYCGSDVKLLSFGRCAGNTVTSTTPDPPIKDNKEEHTTLSTTGDGEATTPPSVAQECFMHSCDSTLEYNPVCGTDFVTYHNPGRLDCAIECGVDVKMLRYGPCPKQQPTTVTQATTTTTSTASSISTTTQSAEVRDCLERLCPMTSEHNPVCGTDNITYTNPSRLNCAAFCGVGVRMRSQGACPARTLNTSGPHPLEWPSQRGSGDVARRTFLIILSFQWIYMIQIICNGFKPHL